MEIIEAINLYLKKQKELNNYINGNRFLVEQKQILPTSINAYKTYTLQIYLVMEDSSPLLIHSISENFNASKHSLDKIYKKLCVEITALLLEDIVEGAEWVDSVYTFK